MDFSITDEQQMVVDTVRSFVEKELMPHEDEVERTGQVPDELVEQIKQRSLQAGIYAANMPEELGGGGLDDLTMAMAERAFGWTGYALQRELVHEPHAAEDLDCFVAALLAMTLVPTPAARCR